MLGVYRLQELHASSYLAMNGAGVKDVHGLATFTVGEAVTEIVNIAVRLAVLLLHHCL